MDQQEQSRWQPTRRQLLWAGATVGLLTIAILIGYRYHITLWDWIKLLVVPVVIAGGGIWFNRQQRERELKIAREQREQEVEIAERRTQDEALQAYLDQMSDMLIPKTDQPSLYKARPGDSLSHVARALTLTVLPRLDKDRKARVVQFLYESGLIDVNRPIVAMKGADLSGTDLRGAYLSGAYLYGANLLKADLSGARLYRANLSNAYLSGAYLYGANLPKADLREAILSRADLREAILNSAVLRGADLSEADLSDADLSEADLSDAHLSDAFLFRADLGEADLSGAIGITNEELDRQTDGKLRGATMPNGQKYEDWLKRRHRGEDGENSGS